jgi:putative tricarboxylic transport membrane protein
MTFMRSIQKAARAASGLAALVMAGTVGMAGHAAAQGWRPDRPVEIIVGTSPGGPQDRQGRLIQRILQERKLIEQPASVVNRPGGGGATGLAYLAQHPGEGQLMQVVAQPLLSNEIAGRTKLSYRNFTPLAIFAVEYVVLAVRPDSPIKDARDFIEHLRKDPAAYSIAIGTTIGNATHTSFAHAMRAAGVNIKRLRTVAFNSGGESITATMGGHIDAMAGSVSTVIAQVRAGHLRLLAVGAPQRLEGELAKVPTWKELGIDSAQDLWRGLAGPPGLSAAQVAFWDATLPKVVKDPEWQKDIEQNLMANVYKNSADTLKYWQSEYAEVKAIFTEMGLAK